MANKYDLTFYLTSSEPNLLQVDSSQSIGGYASGTLYNPTAILSESLNFDVNTFAIEGEFQNPYALVVGEEIMLVDNTSNFTDDYGLSESITVDRAAFSSENRFHAIGDVVYSATKNDLFNGSLSKNWQQYRCIAVKNTGNDIFYNLKFYIKSPSLNVNTSIQIGMETPTTGVLNSYSTGGSTISVVDNTLINIYPNNHFNGRLLVISDPSSNNIGQSRLVASFDASTGTFTFIASMPFPVKTHTQYRVEEPASQILLSGRDTPDLTTYNTNGFTSASGLSHAISINPDNVRPSGNNLMPNETVYLWLMRDLADNNNIYENNRIIFTAVYSN